MSRHEINVTANSGASSEAVWALVADVDSWSEWGLFDESELERPGTDVAEGVGALRRFRTGRIHNQEEVVRFDPPFAFSYEVRKSDIPVRDYRADVMLTSTPEGGTEINWHSAFRSRWPGTGRLVERRLRAFIEETARRLAVAAESG